MMTPEEFHRALRPVVRSSPDAAGLMAICMNVAHHLLRAAERYEEQADMCRVSNAPIALQLETQAEECRELAKVLDDL